MQSGISLQTTRQTNMSPAMQRALSMLQLSTLEFAQQVRESLASNPMLESDDDVDAPGEADAVVALANGEDHEGSSVAESSELGGADASVMSEPWLESGPRQSGSDPDFDPIALAPDTPKLRDMLLQQAGCLNLGERDAQLVRAIIDAIEPTGYLECSLEEIAEDLSSAQDRVDVDELEIALRHVQQFEPAGVGARSVKECLALQIEALPPSTPGRAIAAAIVADHLETFAAHDFQALAEVLDIDEDALADATVLIRRLTPRPGLALSNDAPAYVVPDVQVLKINGRWQVRPRQGALPSVRVNEMYCDMLRAQDSRACKAMNAQLQEARWLVRSIEQRQSTVLRVAQAIVERQADYFEYGDIGMKPMTLRDVADELGLHESTVSRVTANKYMITPSGVIEFKRFFTSGVGTARGDRCSATAVKAMIRQLINAEDERKPLSDHRLTRMLAQRGIQVARRTVSKYRDAMQIPPADIRRLSNRAAA
jgi:RNA polymerase sigma-54 factor